MKGKRGIAWLSQFVIGIIVAVICLLLIAYTVKLLIGIAVGNNDFEQATGTLNDISDKIQLLSEGQTRDCIVLSPKDWQLIQYKEDNQLCICPKEYYAIKQKETCLSKGICQSYAFQLDIIGQCSLERIVNCVAFDKIPETLKINKENGTIRISATQDFASNNVLEEIMALDSLKALIAQRVDEGLPLLGGDKLGNQIVEEILKFVPEEMKAEKYGWSIRVWKDDETAASIYTGVRYLPPSGWKFTLEGIGSEFEDSFVQGENTYKIKLTFYEYVKE